MLKADKQKWTSGDSSSSEERAVKDRRGSAALGGRGGSGGMRFKIRLCGGLSDRGGKGSGGERTGEGSRGEKVINAHVLKGQPGQDATTNGGIHI